jgi:type I restriction enzyme M protein
MLDSDTKARIDSARDILVGKVPDPKSQVEQITIALIYKFMDDMDRQSEKLGGKATFFTGDFKKYHWANLLDKRLGGHERLLLYAEGIEKMNENKNIPQLFRDIFKGVFLPYRDPETLNLFLKEINGFSYDHSERLGDAFEYLLSVLGTQGDAGQFRTPRHIIDFIIAVVDPKKHETVLDPACGTAGFLISAFKHILRNNENLTPDERARLMTNFRGYDIAPDMVRLSRANLYLHGFPNPVIHEYDTLTSEERWDERCDVILANPPFMSPKGGIRPHNRFSIKAKRSEVLFVDYMAEHLNTGGRAGIIVPEGIIFQSQNAYKALRKMLVENYLWAVVSLPAGVFNPYSGVKTCILFLDRNLARQTNELLFVKMESDGFDLGAQRRPNGKNDLPEALKILDGHKKAQKTQESKMALTVSCKRLLESPDINLSGDRYRKTAAVQSKWPMVKLGEVCKVISGQSPDGSTYNNRGEGVPFHQGKTEFTDCILGTAKSWTTAPARIAEPHDIVISVRAPVGPVNLVMQRICIGRGLAAIRPIDSKIDGRFLFFILRGMEESITGSQGAAFASINRKEIEVIEIPLPQMEEQERIVVELEGYRKIIEGARQVLANYKPTIKIDPTWPMVCFEDAPFEIIDGDRGSNYPKKEDFSSSGYCLFLNTKNVRSDGFDFSEMEFVSKEKDHALRKGKLQRGDIVLTTRGTIGNTGLYDESVEFEHIRINSGMLIFRPDCARLSGSFLFHFFQSENFCTQKDAIVSGAAQPQLPIRSLNGATIPLPPLTTQQQIVAEIKAEQALVAANRELIERFEKKIHAALARVWGDDEKKPKTDVSKT